MRRACCHSRTRRILAHSLWLLALTALTTPACTFTGKETRFELNRSIPVRYGYRTTPKFTGVAHQPQPLPELYDGAPHPYLAPGAGSNMHVDGRASDRTPLPGPLGSDPVVQSRALGVLGGQCASANFDSAGNILAVCINFTRPRLLLLNPDSLDVLARYDLPKRIARSPFSIRKIVSDTSGGAYFYIDNQDRAVLASAHNKIMRIAHHKENGGYRFYVDSEFDAAAFLAAQVDEDDRITTVLPDWHGRIWFISKFGVIGFVDPESGHIAGLSLPGQEIQNSFAVAEDGIYVVSDHALYRLDYDTNTKQPRIIWRETYDRGTARKPGMLGQGSGTTPTVIGERFVAIADNAEPRINVLVYDRLREDGDRLICKIPVFENGKSATENSLVSYGNSLIVENNYGYKTFMSMTKGRTSEPGIWRIDVNADQGCRVVWKSQETSPTTVPKLSTANGLLYLYTKNPDHWRLIDAFYLTAIDFRTGETVFKTLTGTGMKFDNNWAAIQIGPDGAAYVGVLNGLVKIQDNPNPVAVANEGRREKRKKNN